MLLFVIAVDSPTETLAGALPGWRDQAQRRKTSGLPLSHQPASVHVRSRSSTFAYACTPSPATTTQHPAPAARTAMGSAGAPPVGLTRRWSHAHESPKIVGSVRRAAPTTTTCGALSLPTQGPLDPEPKATSHHRHPPCMYSGCCTVRRFTTPTIAVVVQCAASLLLPKLPAHLPSFQ